MPTAAGLITYEDSLSMPENALEEIVDGVSRVMPPPSLRHAKLLRFLTRFLDQTLPAGFIALSTPFGLGIQKHPSFTYRGPDIAVFEEERLNSQQDSLYAWVAPELIVECLSPSNRKANVTKLLENYESVRTREVWLIYPELRTVEVYSLSETRLLLARIIASGDLQPPHGNASVSVEDLWEVFYR